MDAIARLRRVVRRHAHVADATIALAVFAATLLTAFGGRPATGGNQTAAVVAAVLGCGALAGRRRRPLAALCVSASAAEVFLAMSGSTSGELILLAPLIALYTVADLVERRPALFLGCGAVAALAVVHAKHSDGRRARLTLSYDRDELRLTIDDLGGRDPAEQRDPAADAAPAGQHGIVGMRERVQALGGRFAAGPRSNSAFQVIAALPYQPFDLAPENRP